MGVSEGKEEGKKGRGRRRKKVEEALKRGGNKKANLKGRVPDSREGEGESTEETGKSRKQR